MRSMLLLLCLLLACTDASHALTPDQANARAQAQTEPAAPKPAKPARKPAAAKPARPDAKGDQRLSESWIQEQQAEGVVTRDRVAAGCWMKYERGRNDLPLEQRADLVNKCVDDTLRAYPDLSH